MRTRQIAERLGVEEAHMMEFQQFNALWDKKMAEYEQKALDLHDAMKVRKARRDMPHQMLYEERGAIFAKLWKREERKQK